MERVVGENVAEERGVDGRVVEESVMGKTDGGEGVGDMGEEDDKTEGFNHEGYDLHQAGLLCHSSCLSA